MLRKRTFRIATFLLALCLLAAAGEAQVAAPGKALVTGIVRTANGVPVPGAALRLVHLESGHGWVTWTDENGCFEFPGFAAGRYRIEVRLLGFDTATHELELSEETPGKVELTLRIAAPAEEKPAAAPEPVATAPQPARPPGAAPTPQPGAQRRAGQPGQAMPREILDALRQRLGQGGFQQVDPTASAMQPSQAVTPNNTEAPPAQLDAGPLGEASSSDAFLISGTVGRGATAMGEGMFGMFGGFGGMGGLGGLGGFGPPGEAGPLQIIMGGAPGGMPGAGMVMIPPGVSPGEPGGRGGREPPEQRPGGAPQPQRPQTGQSQTQRAQDGAGRQRPQGRFGEGVGALWGMQRILRMAANRVRFSIHNQYGNSIWDARPYSLTQPDPPKIAHYRERFGMNLGGPLYIPKIYDGREKTFFFVNYELERRRNPVDTFSTVPLPEERLGDFTARGLQLFDPHTNPSGPRVALGSVIPASLLDPAAVGLLRFIPLPNLPGTVQNYHLQMRAPQAMDRFGVRIIHTISPRLNFQAFYNLNATRDQSIRNFLDLRSRQSSRGQNVMLGLTQNWTPRLLHDTRVNWTRNRVQTLNRFAFREDVAGDLGITGISTDPLNYGVPTISYTNFTDLNDPVPALRRNQTLRLMDNIAYSFPKHTLRAGVELRRMHNNTRNDPTARGSFTFTGLMTSQLDTSGRPIADTGWDFADFLLGLPQSTTVRFGSSSTYFRSWGFVAYVQDDWRVHPRFSLNLGLRYELATPPIELFDHIANLDLNADITAVATVLPGQVAPFSGKLPRSLIRGDYNNWAPRLGIAWRPPFKRSVTVRAGYGLFYNTSIYNQLSASMANQPPHAQAQTRLTSATRLLTLTTGFPPEPPGTVPNTVAVDPNYRLGYAQIWNLSVEMPVGWNVFTELTYTGTKGTNLDLLRAPNRALPGGPLDTELRRRIPNAPGFTYDTFGASSIYHALQVRVQRRMARGLMIMGTYTFGKSLDNASSIGGGAQVVVQDDTNLDAERGLSSFDIRHQFRTFYTYELPFGERKRWLRGGWPAAIFGNWQISGNTTISTGTPFTARVLGSASNNSGTGANFSERADQVGNPVLPRDERTPLRFFNTAAFVLPPPGRFGNAARNTIPGPGTVTFNLAISRFIRFGKDRERRLDFRWEVQNLTNTPNFMGLGTVVNSTNYGRVNGARAMRTMDLQVRVSF